MERESFSVRFSHMAELPVALLALLIIPASLVEDRAQAARRRSAAIASNRLVWLVFGVDDELKLAVAPSPLNGNSLQIRPSSSASIGSKPRSTR